MDADGRRFELDRITSTVIRCAYVVGNVLGPGFLEKVYENALLYQIGIEGFKVEQQCKLNVRYYDIIVGEYIADVLVEKQVIIEIKAVKSLDSIHSAQCLNYLKATKLTVCLLINFGNPKVEVKRIVNNF